MALNYAPFGFRPVHDPSWRGRVTNVVDAVASGYPANIYQGTPLKILADGTLAVVSTITDEIYGFFNGARWTDATGTPQIDNRWISGTVATNISFDVYLAPDVIVEAQADGPVGVGARLDQVNVVNPGAGVALTGISTAGVSATPVGAGNQGQFRVIGFSRIPGNTPGDAYTILKLQIARSPVLADAPAI